MRFFKSALVTAVVVAAAAALPHGEAATKCSTKKSGKVLLYAGTYTRDEGWVNGQGKGVYTFELDTATGALTESSVLEVGVNPTFVSGTRDAARKVVYAINEVTEKSTESAGKNTGYVYAMAADDSGALTILNKMETGGGGPAHVSVSPNEDYVTVSNFGEGSVSIFPIADDGALQNATDFHQFEGGSGVVSPSQDGPHMHSMTWVGKDSMSVLGADLGNDRLAQFTLDAATGKLTPNAENEFIAMPAGSGPRHMAIHPTKDLAFVVDEIDNTVGVFTLNAGGLSAEPKQIISTLPEDFTDASYAADVHVSDDGKFVYASNRVHDSIAIFSLGEDDTLTVVGHEPTRGVAPRSFAIYENFLVVANQNSDSIEVFKIDPETGKLTYAEQKATVGTPVSLFFPRYV